MRAALFDVDGTLLDTNEMHIEAWGRAFNDFGIKMPRERLREQMGNSGERLVKAVCKPDDAARLSKALVERHVEIYTRAFLPHVRPFPGVRELFERLRADGVRIALASSARRAERERQIEILGVRDLLDAVASSEILRDGGVRDAAAIGDSVFDAMAARKAGLRAIGVQTGSFNERRLREAGAEYVYRDIADMLERYDALRLQWERAA